MDTKWKNTLKKIKENYHLLYEKGSVIFLLAFISAVIFIVIFACLDTLDSCVPLDTSWGRVLAGDVFLAITCILLVKTILIRIYNRKTSDINYTYEHWKKSVCRQQCIFLLGGLLVCLGALFYYSREAYTFQFFTTISFASYNTLTYCTPFIVAFVSCEYAALSSMKCFLDKIMTQMDEANQKVIDAAVAAERMSIEATVKSEQLKVDLISNVSHDLKTPLTSMVGYIDLMKKEELNDTLSDYVEVLSNKAEKLKEMIESLFALAKTSSGNIELKPEPLQLNRMVEQICADMNDKISTSQLEFITELTPENTELVTDSSYLYRICQNLIENALKYSTPNTRVFLKTSVLATESNKLLRFEITNTSKHRMDFTKEQIVERFTRGDEARSTEGNGLGLAIVNTYTAALGGEFDVQIDCDQFKGIVSFTTPL